MEDRNKYVKYSLLTLLGIVLAVGITYGFYTADIIFATSPQNTGSVTVSTLPGIGITEAENNYINIDTNLTPVVGGDLDLEGETLDNSKLYNKVTFEVTNTDNNPMEYQLFLHFGEISNAWRSQYVKWCLEATPAVGVNPSCATPTIPTNPRPANIYEGNFANALSYTDFLIKADTLIAKKEGETPTTHSYDLYLWIEDAGVLVDQSALLTGQIEFKLKVDAALYVQDNQE